MNADQTLSARRIGVSFEGLRALEGVDLSLGRGEILGLIGPNGAGKTTLVNVLSGYQAPSEGEVHVAGAKATGWPAFRFARSGIGRTFQAARLFPDLTVLENVELAGVGLGRGRSESRDKARAMLDFFGLSHREAVRANAVSYGEERLVGVARALASDPSFLLLDEPAAGLSPQEALDLMARIGGIRERFGCGILFIEHNMQLIMRLCDRVQVLARGRTIAVGSPAEVQSSTPVRESYLGAVAKAGVQVRRRETPAPASERLLDIDGLVVDYGPVRALGGVSLHVGEGEFVSVVGPNGAGKSTLLAAITGLVRPRSGTMTFNGAALAGRPPAQRVEAGIALVPEGRRILSNMTVEENLRVGEMSRRRDPEAGDRFDYVLGLFPILKERLRGYAGRLSGGEQQQLAIARALLSKPRLLLLDEPSLGLAPMVIDQVYAALGSLNEGGLTILLMEQNANRALHAADRSYVLRHGAMELEGRSGELLDNPAFDRAYFGFEPAGGVATH